jgi:hypothetical protein
MTQSIADYGWMSSSRDGLDHAVLAKRSKPDSQGYIDAACTKVLTADTSHSVAQPGQNICPYCLCAAGEKIGDLGARKRDGAPG